MPADLGYYDLRLPEVRDEQAELAREAGVGAFCYWHYWFGGKGRQLLNEIIDDVLKTGKPDFPFVLDGLMNLGKQNSGTKMELEIKL